MARNCYIKETAKALLTDILLDVFMIQVFSHLYNTTEYLYVHPAI